MKKVTFYTKLNSPTCEKAYLMLMELTYDMPLEIDVVDVAHAHNHELKAIYGERIPVVMKTDTTSEFDWPFTVDSLRDYLQDETK